MAVMAYLAPRIVTYGPAAHEFFSPHNSICQGNAQSNNFAKVILFASMQHVLDTMPMMRMR
eukprot:10423251-Alexandrium_andersonii.AAC.1